MADSVRPPWKSLLLPFNVALAFIFIPHSLGAPIHILTSHFAACCSQIHLPRGPASSCAVPFPARPWAFPLRFVSTSLYLRSVSLWPSRLSPRPPPLGLCSKLFRPSFVTPIALMRLCICLFLWQLTACFLCPL